MDERDERIERIRTGLAAVVNFGTTNGVTVHLKELDDLKSIEADLAELPLAKAQLELVTKQRDTKAAVIRDYIEDEDAARELLRPYLTEFELEGDSYGVPGFVQWIETLIEKYKAVTHECAVAKRALDIAYEMADSDGCCKGSDCPEWELYRTKPISQNCDCKRAALAMAEKELSK